MTQPPVPQTGAVGPEWLLKFARAINEMLKGRLNNVGTVTLTANAATTTITDTRISSTSAILLQPTTANAAAEIGNGTLYVPESGRAQGAVAITHANNAQTDRTFRYAVMG